METILQAVLDVAGVSAAMMFDAGGRVVCHRGHSIYDRPLCEQLSATLVKAIDTVELQQEDWETISARYADGKLLLRKIEGGPAGRHVLAVVADTTLNPSFATVAIRVAANKLKKALGGGGSSMLSVSPALGASQHPPPLPGISAAMHGSSVGAGSSPHLPPPNVSRPSDSKVLASSGLSWSQSSSIGLSRVAVADPASSTFLTKVAKGLARYVGPMAKVYVEEGVRRVTPDAAFSLSVAARLVEDLAGQIEDAEDRESFRKAFAKL
jgi:predicted regulator of Ras-like GTPase activity (Roadblock/LC7/MglB family)